MFFIFIYYFAWITLKCTAYDVAVTYTKLKIGSREFYSYHDSMYSTKKDMMAQIIVDHPKVKLSRLLLLCIGMYNTSENVQEPSQFVYENPFPIFASKQLSKVIVHEYYSKGLIYYKCFDKTFTEYRKASYYAKAVNFKLHFTFKKKKEVKMPDAINVLKKVGWIGYSDRVWRRVWKSCWYYSCFAPNNFRQFKLRLLNEINIYRTSHGGRPVKVHKATTGLAERYLHAILHSNERLLDRRLLQFYIQLPYYFGTLAVKKWYDEGKNYKYDTKVAITGTEHFSTMVWKGVTHVGIAVQEVGNMLHIVIFFEPTSNIPKMFSKNVAKRRMVNFG